MLRRSLALIFALVTGLCFLASPARADTAARQHPCLILTPAEQSVIKQNLGRYPLFDATYQEAVDRVETALKNPIDVPIPKDAAGYTHERHKRNYIEMQAAGFLYQITGDVRYFDFVKKQLDLYAELYPKLDKHPAAKNQAYGRLFWQSLNETVWLVYVSQAYDCIYNNLTPADRARYEGNIFRPMVKFLAENHGNELDRIHNHGTWTVTAVGMIGYVMGDDDMVQKALYGSKKDGKAGYFKQLDLLFSPDGFYCEGPYYGRYALMPFFLFAQVIENNQPELKVFAHRDHLLGKALQATLQQSWLDGTFLPLNDSLKEKSFLSAEIVLALNLTYAREGQEAALLPVARKQNTVALNAAGLAVAAALAAEDAARAKAFAAFPYRTLELTDGPEGKSGGLAILRSGANPAKDSLLTLKYTAFGMEHGHYDKLSISYYDNGNEIIQDYGSARFLNVDQKWGGRYLPENQSYAKQTVAHSTVVVDEGSQYGGKYKVAENQHSDRHFTEFADPDFQVASARDTSAYPGVAMQRTTMMVRDARLENPIIVDIYRLVSKKAHRYDIPYYYQGTFLAANVALTNNTTNRAPLGTKDGYQHLWLDAKGQTSAPLDFTWMVGSRYYTLHVAAMPDTQLLLTEIGANDPNMNLRNDRGFILRRDVPAGATVFASVIEPHGDWNATTEITYGCTPVLKEVTVLASSDEGTVVRITGEKGIDLVLMVSNREDSKTAKHTVTAGSQTYTWEGNAVLKKQ